MPVFDSDEFVKRMAGAGMPEGQAQVLAHDAAFILDTLATKDDFTLLKTDLERLRLEIQRDMAECEKRLLVRMGTLFAAGFGLFFAALTLVIVYVN